MDYNETLFQLSKKSALTNICCKIKVQNITHIWGDLQTICNGSCELISLKWHKTAFTKTISVIHIFQNSTARKITHTKCKNDYNYLESSVGRSRIYEMNSVIRIFSW